MGLPQNKKILFFSNQGLSTLHLGLELEIIERLLNENNEVLAVTCDNKLSTCFFNPTHNLLACAICEARTTKFHNKYEGLSKLSLKDIEIDYTLPVFNNLEELIAINYNEINIGRGVASSLISLFREYDVNKIPNIKELALENAKMAINVIENFNKLIIEHNPDEVFLFNGRFTEVYALTQLCEKLKLTYKTYETGALRSKYIIKENTTVHNIYSFQKDIEDIKEKISLEVVVNEGKKIFEDRMKGKQGEVFNYLTLQKEGALPKDFNNEKNNVVIFNSSEDEMKVIKDWTFDSYSNQGEALEKFFDYFKQREDIHFYLRVHPNLLSLDNSQTDDVKKLNYGNLTIIGADESIDTYALIQACNKTICFGSTVGVEATYLKKPSILFGNSFYKGMDCVYEPNTYEELFELIDQSLTHKESDSIYTYIYTAYNRGFKVNNFVFNGKNNSSYKKEKIKRIYPKTIFNFIKYLKRYKLWKKMSLMLLNENLKWSNLFKLKSHTFNKTHQVK